VISETVNGIHVMVDVTTKRLCRSLDSTHVVKLGKSGAWVTFIGMVREFNDSFDQQPIEALFLEHYPGMTEKVIVDIATEAVGKWPSLQGVSVLHRVGYLTVAEEIVKISVASSHRSEAFNATMFIMDMLKVKAPFWKNTVNSCSQSWVKAKHSDAEACERWL
jgi:molybdopterin synthase catalytic subunit